MDIFFMVLIVIVAIWFTFIRKTKPKSAHDKVVHGKYHCVEVHCAKGACTAARKLEGKRILSREAPVFPLSDCDIEKCQCRFQHHEERRAEDRRGVYNKALNEITQNTMSLVMRSEYDRRR